MTVTTISWSRAGWPSSRTPTRSQPHQVSFGKFYNVRAALEVCREARSILGGSGITTEYSPLRHAVNLETVYTYEGTHEVHTLVLGERLTGFSAYR